MLMSIVGFLVATLIIWPVSMTWGFTFAFVFTIWFVAAVYNFTHAEGEEHLDIHGSTTLKRVR